MEPIRPDEDELRASDRRGKEQKPADTRRTRIPEKKKGRPAGSLAMGVLLVGLVAAGGAGWYAQQQQIQAMEEQLEEADYWARQSKLALARFEGELSETGETLEQREESLRETLSKHADRLDTADSEISKLWGVANDRNRKRLDANEAAISSLQEGLAPLRKSVTGFEQQLSELTARTSGYGDTLDSLSEADASLTGRLDKAESAVATVEESTEQQLQRFAREQKLTLDGLDSRITAVEADIEGLTTVQDLADIRESLNELEQAVDSIDSARSQLTSRLIRLSEQVDALRAGQ